jgi:hypothetical protein
MNPTVAVMTMAVLAAATSAQSYIFLPASLMPDSNELPDYALRPFMQPNSRVQMFFDATEAGGSAFNLDELTLRFDGPIPQVGAPGPFTIQRLRISVGTTTVAIPGARFLDNLSQPLQNVFDSQVNYYPDPGTAAPQQWGAPSNSLVFPFTSSASVAIPTGGWLVVDLQMEGNNISAFGFSHAILDAARTTGGPVDGAVSNYGTGCSVGPGLPTATIATTGVHAPGAAHFVSGSNLGANAPVLIVVGVNNVVGPLGNLPFAIPGTTCSFRTSFELWFLATADASGALVAGQDTGLALPSVPAFAGINLYEQLVSLVPGANAPWDLVLSDARQIQLGTLTLPGRGTWTVSHGADADAAIADKVEALGYAVRLRTH